MVRHPRCTPVGMEARMATIADSFQSLRTKLGALDPQALSLIHI